MNKLKLLLRLVLKIPGTPILLLSVAFMLSVFYVVQFFQWIYNAREWDKGITQDIKQAQFDLAKRWFTEL